ncbi:MarR family transcriptional regulator [Mariniblastus sp.]|nr:MarR family transcriptional regulator [Mariniblastus sp.]
MAKLEKQLKKRGAFESVEAEVVISVLRTNELFQHKFGQLFREFGLNQPQYNVLRILYGERDRLPSLEIASRMITVVPAITGLVDKLEKKELVKRERGTEDRRVWYVQLTKKGEKLIEQMRDSNTAMHKRLVGQLTKKEAKQLLELLQKARESTENWE